MGRISTLTLFMFALAMTACDSDGSGTPSQEVDVQAEESADTGSIPCEGVLSSATAPTVIAAFRICTSPMAGFPIGFTWGWGERAAYLYSDGTLVYRAGGSWELGPTVPFQQIKVTEQDYCALVDGISAAGFAQEAHVEGLSISQATDMPNTEVFLGQAEGEGFVSMYGDLFDDFGLVDEPASVAPNAVKLTLRLHELAVGGSVLVPETVEIAAYVLTDGYASQACPLEGAVQWPFPDLALADFASDGEQEPTALTLTGQKAQAVREWWIQEALSPPCNEVFVKVGEVAYGIQLADVPPGGASTLPFPRCVPGGL